MPAASTSSPWHFLTALDGDSHADRELLKLTRKYELAVVSDMIAASRVSLLYSMSGNGKTSLVNAGIVPEFRERGYAVFRTRPRPPWCTDDPAMAFRMSALREARLPLFTPAELHSLTAARGHLASCPPADAEQVAKLLSRVQDKVERLVTTDPDQQEFCRHMESCLTFPIARFVEEIRRFLDPDTRMLFICDQFEEMFVHFANSARLQTFAEQIGEMHRDPALKTHLLFSMREDWVGSMIEFRSEIPDIFVSYFKLDPLHQSRGMTVLSEPLAREGLEFSRDAAELILHDLAAAYSLNARARGGISAVPSPETDPFIEAPALQIVAERLWETRAEVDAAPFSVAHYQSLAHNGASASASVAGAETRPQGDSPAQHVLNSYLDGLLGSFADASETLTELRIDCLYLLTDTVRHRRAVGQRALLREVRALRPQALDLPQVDESMVTAAMEPLKNGGLVREFQGVDGTRHYELVHDFAVRNVVRRWHQLDRKRTEALAILRSDAQRRHTTLTRLLEAERMGLKALGLLLGLSVGIMLAMLGAVVWEIEAGGTARWLPGAGTALVALSFTGAFFALRERRPFSFALNSLLLVLGSWVLWTPSRDPTSTFWILALAVVAGVPLSLRALVELIAESSRPPVRSRALRVLLAELVDGWTPLLVVLSVGWVMMQYMRYASDLLIILVLSTVTWIVGSSWLMARSGASVGCRMAGLTVEAGGGGYPRFGRAVIRQVLIVVWTTAGWFFVAPDTVLVAVVVGPLVAATLSFINLSREKAGGRNFYDVIAGIQVRHLDSYGSSEPSVPWAMAVIPAGVACTLFLHFEGARRAQSDFAELRAVLRNMSRAERTHKTVNGNFTTDVNALRNFSFSGPYYPGVELAADSVGIVVRAGYGRGTECVALLSGSETASETLPYCRRINPADTFAVVLEDTSVVMPVVIPDTDTVMLVDTAAMAGDSSSGFTP